MNEYTAWEHWFAINTPLVLLMFAVMSGAVAKLALMLWKTHKDAEGSNIDRLVKSIEALVARIDELFEKHDGHGVRIGKLEKRIGEHFIRCNEREKVIEGIQETQRVNIIKYDSALMKRQADIPCTDRTDRES